MMIVQKNDRKYTVPAGAEDIYRQLSKAASDAMRMPANTAYAKGVRDAHLNLNRFLSEMILLHNNIHETKVFAFWWMLRMEREHIGRGASWHWQMWEGHYSAAHSIYRDLALALSALERSQAMIRA